MNQPTPVSTRKPAAWRRYAMIFVTTLLIYFIAAYLLMPLIWKTYERRHPALDDIPGITETGSHIPGDPLNITLVGTKAEVIKIMLAAKWYPADPLSLKSCLEIAEATLFKREYDAAPVSSLYLFGRKEDLAFEQPVGHNPRERHHVRFWRTDKIDPDGRPLWIGSAIFDQHVGISRTTGQVTHVTAPDVDKERDYLMTCLEQTGHLVERYVEKNFHKVCQGKNGGGDPWKTDGDLVGGVIEFK